jgi:hypothetical protein
MQIGGPIVDSSPSNNDLIRSFKLGKAKNGSGHDNFLKGIIVQFDLKYPQYLSPQLQRYHWVDIISSQSKMHKLTSIENLSLNCNKYVLTKIINEVEILIEIYNSGEFPYKHIVWSTCPEGEEMIIINNKEECFNYIISNLPMGYELWMGISTNYLQLKTIYHQRKNHKLDEWKVFCNFIEGLDLFKDLILK